MGYRLQINFSDGDTELVDEVFVLKRMRLQSMKHGLKTGVQAEMF